MKRKIYKELLEWKTKRSGEEALLIDGARRVGKSWIVEEFGKKEYKSFIKIDFSQDVDGIKQICDNYISNPDQFFKRLELWSGKSLYDRNSLIIFDEVQDYPRAREAIKWLVADGRYDFIETGSLMSIRKNTQDINIPSEEYHINMYPMDFEEFMWAVGEDMLMDFIKECYDNLKPLEASFHRKAMDLLRTYLVVGGMPQSVLKYISTENFEQVDHEKRRILQLYRDDIYKYAGAQVDKVIQIWDSIPSQLQKHENRFHIGDVKKGARTREYKSAFVWLEEARTINVCYGATEPSVGLKLSRDDAKYKLYLGDTGLLISHTFDAATIKKEELYRKLILNKLEINAGMLVENLVAQLLRSAGHELYFFSSYSKTDSQDTMEVDFLIRKPIITSRHNICPIEVKSSKNDAYSSLMKFKDKFANNIDRSIVLSASDVKKDNGIWFLPLYMAGLL